ncbi:putative peptide/nitrate transporter [Apostasia shenzhenica]|uniref:Putative peptide/nitrate transporter n=1 Tax=Apostasia shenzhenica TaxID=1088818 RepID=A0A2I0AMN6_9ASPA|nr:putative peptide/nitrate transporter [Apostasia shenzhenica]
MATKAQVPEKGENGAPPEKQQTATKEERKDAGEEEGTDSPEVIKHRGWQAMPYVIGNETFEKLGTLGTSSNLLVYLTTVFHMNGVTAATLLQIFNGTTNLAPLLGAFLSDTYLGRYVTIGFASVASLVGMIVLTLTAAIPILHPPSCTSGETCVGPSPVQLSFLFLSFAFLFIGAGGIRPCNLAFGADQFDPRTESGRRGINSFFNWYYFTLTIAMMVSSTVIIYLQSNVSWTLGLAIPAFLMFLSCVFFFVGTNIYVKVKPEGSPFASVARVLVAAYKKRKLDIFNDGVSVFDPPPEGRSTVMRSKLPRTDQFRWLDRASIITSSEELNADGQPSDPWRLCSTQNVEEVKCIARILPVWSAGTIYYIALTQQSTYVVFQALQSDRRLPGTSFQIPAGSFSVFNMLALTIWLPIYDRFVVPRLQRITKTEGGITVLQRMGVGIVVSIAAQLVAALVEEKRRDDAVKGTSSMSGLWLIPQLMLCGLSEAFNVIGQVEFYYKQFPENMRSVGGAFFFCGLAISSYLSSLIVTIVHQTTGGDGKENWLAGDLNKGRLDLFYYLNAGISMVNFGYFLVCARWYRYKDFNAGGAQEMALMEGKKSGEAFSV